MSQDKVSRSFRISKEMDDEIEEVCERYAMNKTGLVRQMLRAGLHLVESEGVDALADQADSYREGGRSGETPLPDGGEIIGGDGEQDSGDEDGDLLIAEEDDGAEVLTDGGEADKRQTDVACGCGDYTLCISDTSSNLPALDVVCPECGNHFGWDTTPIEGEPLTDGGEVIGEPFELGDDGPADVGHDLTLFQVDLLIAAAKMDRPSGADIVDYLVDQKGKYDVINHGRLYPNLDELQFHGLVEKGSSNRRTNYYEVTGAGRGVAEYRSEWTDLDD